MGHDVAMAKVATLRLLKSPSCTFSFLANRPTTTPVKAEAMTPAPPRDAAPGQVDEGMADEADQGAGHGAVHGGQQTEHRVLQADVGVGHRAGDSDKAPQNKEQGCADADGNEGFTVRVFMIPHSF